MTPSIQVCNTCGFEKPLTEDFYHKDPQTKAGFKKKCKVCKEQETAQKSEEKHDALLVKIEEQGRKLLSKLVETEPRKGGKTPHIAELFQHIMQVFGGSEGYARQVVATYFASAPGSRTRQSILMDIGRMGVKVSEQGHLSRDMKDVSTGDIKRILDERLRQVTLCINAPVEEMQEHGETDLRANAG